jgi:hypothetical protein
LHKLRVGSKGQGGTMGSRAAQEEANSPQPSQ